MPCVSKFYFQLVTVISRQSKSCDLHACLTSVLVSNFQVDSSDCQYLQNWLEILTGNRSFRQPVSSPTAEVVSPMSNVSSPTLICQFANVQNTLWIDLKCIYKKIRKKQDVTFDRGWIVRFDLKMSVSLSLFHSPQSLDRRQTVILNCLNHPWIDRL